MMCSVVWLVLSIGGVCLVPIRRDGYPLCLECVSESEESHLHPVYWQMCSVCIMVLKAVLTLWVCQNKWLCCRCSATRPQGDTSFDNPSITVSYFKPTVQMLNYSILNNTKWQCVIVRNQETERHYNTVKWWWVELSGRGFDWRSRGFRVEPRYYLFLTKRVFGEEKGEDMRWTALAGFEPMSPQWSPSLHGAHSGLVSHTGAPLDVYINMNAVRR